MGTTEPDVRLLSVTRGGASLASVELWEEYGAPRCWSQRRGTHALAHLRDAHAGGRRDLRAIPERLRHASFRPTALHPCLDGLHLTVLRRAHPLARKALSMRFAEVARRLCNRWRVACGCARALRGAVAASASGARSALGAVPAFLVLLAPLGLSCRVRRIRRGSSIPAIRQRLRWAASSSLRGGPTGKSAAFAPVPCSARSCDTDASRARRARSGFSSRSRPHDGPASPRVAVRHPHLAGAAGAARARAGRAAALLRRPAMRAALPSVGARAVLSPVTAGQR